MQQKESFLTHKKEHHGPVIHSEPTCGGHDWDHWMLIAQRYNKEVDSIIRLLAHQATNAEENGYHRAYDNEYLQALWRINVTNLEIRVLESRAEFQEHFLTLAKKMVAMSKS